MLATWEEGQRRQPLALVRSWWRRWGSNPRPQACKARALPAELRPQVRQGRLRVIIAPAATRLALGRLFAKEVVGPTRFELVTSRLSAGRSDQLSYGPNARNNIRQRTPSGQPRIENRSHFLPILRFRPCGPPLARLAIHHPTCAFARISTQVRARRRVLGTMSPSHEGGAT